MSVSSSKVNVINDISSEIPAPAATVKPTVGEKVAAQKPNQPLAMYAPELIRERVPQELQSRAQWMIWANGWVEREDSPPKWQKQPRMCKDGTTMSNRKRRKYQVCGYGDSLNTLDEAIEAQAAWGDVISGVGIALLGTGVVGIDIDGYTPDSEWANELLEKLVALRAYIEISPSGTGVRAFLTGKLSKAFGKKFPGPHTALEMWDSGRYLTVTGVPMALEIKTPKDGQPLELFAQPGEPYRGGNELPDGQEIIDWLEAKYQPEPLPESVQEQHKATVAAYVPRKGESTDADDYPWVCEMLFEGHFNGRVDDYKAWLEMGFGLVSRFGAQVGLELWDTWSQRGANYEAGVCRYKVGTFDKTGKPSRINFGSIVTWAREAGAPLQAKNDPSHPDRWKKSAKAQPAAPKAIVEAKRPQVDVGGGGGGDDGDDTDDTVTDNRPMIENSDKDLHKTLEAVIKILTTCPNVYTRNGRVVEVRKVRVGDDTGKLEIADIAAERLAALFTPRAVLFKWKWNKQKEKWVEQPEPAVPVMKLVLPQGVFPGVPELVGVQEAPYFYGGRFINAAGYDQESGLLLDGELMVNPPVIGNITELQTIEAARFIEETLSVLGYASDPRQGCWQIAQITMSLQTRWLHRIRPANLITAPEQASGKTEATDLAVKAGTGRKVVSGPTLVGNKNFDGELFSLCGGGASYLLFDNLEDGFAFGNATLDRVITSGVIAGRPLNQNSRIEERPANAVIIANGNNIASGADMNRRCLMTRLVKRPDLGGERYGDRFTSRRKDFARACAIVVAWHIQNGCPAPTEAVMQPENFGDWGKYVRDAIWYASKLTGAPIDVMLGRKEMAKEDTKKGDARDTLYAFWLYWNGGEYGAAAKGRQPFTSGEVAAAVLRLDSFPHAAHVAGVLGNQRSTQAVGRKLRPYQDHSLIVGKEKFTLRYDLSDHTRRAWKFDAELLDPEEEYPGGYLAELDEYPEDETESTPF